MTSTSNLHVGLHFNSVKDIQTCLDHASYNGHDFVVVPLFHPRQRRDTADATNGLLTRSDMVLNTKTWTSNVVGTISEWIDLDNSSVDIRKKSEEAVKQEFQWASHLGLQAVIFPTPAVISPNFNRTIRQFCSDLCHQQIWVHIPLAYPLNKSSQDCPVHDSWEVWEQVRTACGHTRQVSVALELTEDLPRSVEVIDKWACEPVRALIINTSVFTTNDRGLPVLSGKHQHIVKALFLHKASIILRGKPKHAPPPTPPQLPNAANPQGGAVGYQGTAAMNYTPYTAYLRHLLQMTRKEEEAMFTIGERLCCGYNDVIQAPLQPLMDNLESSTYEVFEQDPVKYYRYEQAIALALEHTLALLKSQTEGYDVDRSPIVVMVVGAGRGPLVQAALSASCSTNVPIRVFAVEKNSNAVITLRNRSITESWSNVEIISVDMRFWSAPCKADIMVSELLGSWGDNELSPECLDGAQKYLHPEHGISIPQAYTSYLAPLSSNKLWNSAKAAFPADSTGKGLETPYVVKLHQCHVIHDEKPVFTFIHPNHSPEPIDNTRYETLSFEITQPHSIHGFSGTFDCQLYDSVHISTAPLHNYSKGMFSWFQLYIPLLSPLRVKTGDVFTVHFWRCNDGKRVWYEWYVSSPSVTPIQNPNGRSYWIGL